MQVGVSSCECIACFWSSSFMRALLIDCSFSVFVWFLCYNLSNYLFWYLKNFLKDWHVTNNSNVAKELYFIVFNCKSNEKEIIFDKDKMSKREKSKLVFCLFGSLKWFVGLNNKKISLQLHTWLRRDLACSRRDPGIGAIISSK